MEKTYPVLGHSMRFLLEPGDAVLARPCGQDQPRAGSLALLVKWDQGRPAGYVIHRVLFNSVVRGRRLLLTKGDANFLPDLPPAAFQPVGLVTGLIKDGQRLSAAPGAAWLLLCLYSFAANKFLFASAWAAALLFYCARALLPGGLAALLNPLYLAWEARLYPALARLAACPVRRAAPGAPACPPAALKTGRIRSDQTWSGRVIIADYLTVERGAAVTVLPGTELVFERREAWFFPVLRAGAGGQLRELESASAKILVYGSFTARGSGRQGIVFTGGSFGGVHALGRGELSLAACRFEKAAAFAVSGRDDARLDVSAADFHACRGAVEASGRAYAGLSGLSIADCGAGVAAADDAGVFLKNCVFKRNKAALEAAGRGLVRAAGCLFEEQRGPAGTFSGGGLAEFSGCEFTGGVSGLSFSKGYRAKLTGCVFSGSTGPALQVYSRARAEVRECVLAGGTSALLLEGGRAALRGVKMTGTPFPGVVCANWRLLFAEQVTYEGRPWFTPKPRGGPSRCRRLLFLAAAGTARLPVFGTVYRLLYLAAIPAARRLLALPGVSALYLYRGMAARGWVPGLSDMDLACVLEAPLPGGEAALYSRLGGRLRLLRTLFPFTGEVMLATAPEFSSFLGCWGVKGAEFKAASRLLSGLPLELKPAPPTAGIADQTEAFYAYTLLTRHFLSAGQPEAFARRNCLKNLVDVKRYLAAPCPERASRAAYASLLGLPLESYLSLERGDAAYQAFLALHLAGAGLGHQISLEPGAAKPAAGWLKHTAFDGACDALARDTGLGLGAALDALYRLYLVLPDSCAGDQGAYLRACAALRAARGAALLPGASPLVLTQSSFALLCRLPYLNNPAFGQDLAVGSAGLIPYDGGVYCRSLVYSGTKPSPESLRAAASLAARHFCVSWRSLWPEMPPHYFYTRALGLRLLLEKGEAPPFSAPALLRAAFGPKTGAGLPAWDAYYAEGAGAANYDFIARQAAALGGLADAR